MSEIIKDINGREIEVAQVRGSALSRLTRVAGAAWGQNEWSIQTLARASVVGIASIPRDPRPFQTTEDLDRLWDTVDDAAADAAVVWMIEQQKKLADDAKNSSALQVSETVSGS